MDKSDILDKIKNDISQSGQDITNSIDAFNNNLNRINNYINPNEINSKVQNKEQILKTSSDMEIFKDSSSLTSSFNKLNKKNKPNINMKSKINDPNADILCKKLQQKIDTLNYENFVLKKKNKDLTSKNEDLNFELNSLNHNKKTQEMMLNEELDSVKLDLKQKNEEILKLNEKLKIQEENMTNQKNNNKLNTNLKAENDKLTKDQKKLNETIMNLENDLKFYKNQFNKVNSENEMAKQEKEKMNKDNFFSNKKREELNEENLNLKDEINELKKEKDKLLKKISENDNIKRNEYQNKMDIEKERMEKKLKEELERIKFEQKSIMEIEMKTLKEKNEDLKYKINELKDKMKSNNNDIIIEEIKKQNATLNDEASYLKLQIQLKDSENARLNKIYKENINLIGELNQENNQLKEKLNVITNKLKEVTSNSLIEITEAREKIALLASKADSYEKNDNTFDKIFSEIVLDEVNTNNNEESKNMISAINQMPQGYNKIISQCKFMASRLKKLYEEKAVINAKLENMQIEKNKFNEQNKILKNMEQNNNESYEYLLKELEKKDSDLLYYKEALNDREIRFKQVMKENENITARCVSLEKDLKQILENRDKINKLDFLVGKIVENQKIFFGKDTFKQPSGNKNNMNKGGKNQIVKSNKVKFK